MSRASRADLPQLKSRLGKMETELRRLRRLVGESSDEIPKQRFGVLEVFVCGSRYAVPIAQIREVVSAPCFDALPDVARWVLGTFCYGREVVPVIDLGRRLTGEASASVLSDLVVVVETTALLGMRVSAVRNVIEVDPLTLSQPSTGGAEARFLLGSVALEQGALHILSPRLFDEDQQVEEPVDEDPT